MTKVRLRCNGGFNGIDKCVGKIFDATQIMENGIVYDGFKISIRDLVAQGGETKMDNDYHLIFFKSEVEVCEDE